MPKHKPPTKTLNFGGSNIKDDVMNGGQFTGKESDDELVTQIISRRDIYLEQTRTTRRQWLLNAAFARGQQWSHLHRTEDRLITLREPGQRRMVTIDLIGPWKEHMLANMVMAIPKYEAIPANTDPESISAARLGTDLIMYYWDTWQFLLQYVELCNYLLDFGTSYIYLNYKEDYGRYVAREVIDPESGAIQLNDEGQPLIQKSPIGDLYSVVLPPQSVFCPIDSGPLKDKIWVGIQQKQTMDYFREMYDDGKDVLPEVVDYKNIYSLHTIEDSGATIEMPQTATEVIYFQKPSEILPEGMIAVVAGTVLLSKEPWPYEKLLDYPLESFSLARQSGEFYARSWIERQIPIQKLYNLIWTIMTENADDMGHQKLLRPRNSGIGTPSDLPEVIDYNPPNLPSYLQLPPMPEYIVGMIGMLEVKMRDVQNYHGASMGSSVSGVRSDVHAQNLQDQDLLPLTVMDNMLQASFESLGEKILIIASEKLSEERIIQFVGENKRIMIRPFRGSMLGNTRKVKVRMTNAWMRSKNAMTQNILQMFQMGGIIDRFRQPDTQKLLRMLEFALPDTLFREMQQSSEIAYHEIDQMLQGEAALVLPWQDHKLFLDVLNEYMNSSAFMQIIAAAKSGDKEAEKIFGLFFTDMTQRSQALAQAMGAMAPPAEQGNQKQQQGKPQGRTAQGNQQKKQG